MAPLQSDRENFPGLRPVEARVLRQWLKLHEREFDRFDYNVRIGAGTDPGEEIEPNVRKGFIESTQMRVDVVARRGEQPTLIEVKDRATAAAIGQLIVYSHHWGETFPSSPTPKLLVIAYSAVTGIPEAMRARGVAFEQVFPPA
jgi:hypothetical protein